MMSTVRMEQRHAVQFMARLGRTTSETHQLLTTAYQDDALRKPATRTYHNRFQTLGMNVYEQTPKIRKSRVKRSRKSKTLSNIKGENNQRKNNLGSDAESDFSDDSFNDSFLGFDENNHSANNVNISNNSFDETIFQNKSTNYVYKQKELHDKENYHRKEEEYDTNEPNNSSRDLPSSNQKHDCINDSDEIDSHNEQARQSFLNLDLEESNITLSNDNSLAENSIMMSIIAVDNQYERDIPAIERTITDSNQYGSNLVENESTTEITSVVSTLQNNDQVESPIETNASQNSQQNGQGNLNRDESYTNYYYLNLNGELRLERTYFPEC